MEDNIVIENQQNWFNVLDYAIKNDLSQDVSKQLQALIDAVPEDSVLYFPAGTYLFQHGVTIEKRLTLCGDAYFGSNRPNAGNAGATDFRAILNGDTSLADFSIITFKGVTHCVRSICFFADTCNTISDNKVPTEMVPKYHHAIENNVEHISAITYIDGDQKEKGIGSYDNLFMSGFSGTALKMADSSIAHDVTVFTCDTAFITGENSMISNAKSWGCRIGMVMSTGTNVHSTRIEEVGEIAIKNIGKGYNSLTALTIDQCGFCGIWCDEVSHMQVAGNITRCGQYYYKFRYEDFLKIHDAERIDEAFALIHGTSFHNCSFQLANTNEDNWVDKNTGPNAILHYVWVLRAKKTSNVTVQCLTLVNDELSIEVEKGNIRYDDYRVTITLIDGKQVCVNGIGQGDIDHGEALRVQENRMVFNIEGKKIKAHSILPDDVIMSYGSISIDSLEYQYQCTLEYLGYRNESNTKFNYYRVLDNRPS